MSRDRFGKVAVLMGGRSAEREISLQSGTAVLEALRRQGVDAHAFDPSERPMETLLQQGFNRAHIALHGRFGEDGTVQGALELMGLPYTGSGVLASALAMDKWRTKLLWQAAGISTPRHVLLTEQSDFDAVAEELGLPLIVKPSREGSTIGLSKVTAARELPAAYRLAAKHDSMVLAEQFIKEWSLPPAFLAIWPCPWYGSRWRVACTIMRPSIFPTRPDIFVRVACPQRRSMRFRYRRCKRIAFWGVKDGEEWT